GPFKLARWRHDSEIDLVKLERLARSRPGHAPPGEREDAQRRHDRREPPSRLATPRLTWPDRRHPTPRPGSGSRRSRYCPRSVPTTTGSTSRRSRTSISGARWRMAIDRTAIIDNITQANQLPAHSFVPKRMPGFSTMDVESQWLPPGGQPDRDEEAAGRATPVTTTRTGAIRGTTGWSRRRGRLRTTL